MATEHIVEHTGPHAANVLPDDVLWEIFNWNGNIFVKRGCLETALRSSQVCRSWRSFSLASPSLWGRLLDFRALNQKSDRWREEVLKRSGDSLLWIHATLIGLSSNAEPEQAFLYSLLESRWERIQHLHLVDLNRFMKKEVSSFLQRPAPNLRSCILYSSLQRPQPLFPTFRGPLFNDTAPSLQYISIDFVFFRLTAPWFSQLKRLEILNSFTLVEILKALQVTRLLEFLGVYSLAPREVHASRLPFVNLPKLREVHVRLDSTTHAVDLLAQMQPAESCILRLSTIQFPISAQEYEDPSKRLPYLAQRYLRGLDIKRIDFWVSSGKLSFSGSTSSGDTVFELGFSSQTREVFPSLFHASDFSSVSKLYLEIPSYYPISASNYFPFFHSFTSVTDLHIKYAHTLMMFLDMPTGASVNFPLLTTLQINSFEQSVESSTDSVTDAILPFLQQRCDSGLPLRTLILWMSLEQATRDLNALTEIPGLQVHWRGR